MISENKFIAVISISLSILLFKCVEQRKIKSSLFLITLFLFLILSLVVVRSNFDKNILKFTPEDLIKLNHRHFYYAEELGQIFLNRKVLNYYKNYSLPIYKLEDNLFSNLDINLYFFASHPRERVGLSEFEKFSPLFLPLFIIGALLLIYKQSIESVTFFILATLVSAFISPDYSLGPILFFPFIILCINTGLIYFIKFIRFTKI